MQVKSANEIRVAVKSTLSTIITASVGSMLSGCIDNHFEVYNRV